MTVWPRSTLPVALKKVLLTTDRRRSAAELNPGSAILIWYQPVSTGTNWLGIAVAWHDVEGSVGGSWVVGTCTFHKFH